MSLNRVILQGRIVRDPELNRTPSGVEYTKFAIAVDRNYKGTDGEKQADFISCQAWRKTAELITKWFTKGKPIIVEGTLMNNNYESNGVKHYSYVVQVDSINFVPETKSDAQNDAPPSSSSTQAPPINLDEYEEIIGDGDLPF